MIQKRRLVLGMGLLSVVLVSGWVLASQVILPTKTISTDHVEGEGAGVLDGLEFSGVFDVTSKSTATKDRFLFSKGKFVSTECVKRCGYRPGAYFVRSRDGKTEFISVSHCTYKDAKIVWRGTVEGGIVKGVSTWTVSRWYRTVEKKFQFEGKLTKSSMPIGQK